MPKTGESTNEASSPPQATTIGLSWVKVGFTLPPAVTAAGLRFASRRLEAQANLLTTLIGAKGWAERLEAETSFAKAAVAEYSAGRAKLVAEAQHAISPDAGK